MSKAPNDTPSIGLSFAEAQQVRDALAQAHGALDTAFRLAGDRVIQDGVHAILCRLDAALALLRDKDERR